MIHGSWVSSSTLSTISPADYGLKPLVIPPPGSVLSMLAALLLFYVTLLFTTRRVLPSLLTVTICASAFALLILFARSELGLLAEELPVVSAWGALLGLLGRGALDALIAPPLASDAFHAPTLTIMPVQARTAVEFVVALGSLSFAFAFMLRFGGLIYPQFLSSDILLHVHKVQLVLSGQWVFPELLPDGTPVPYPNALYILLAPLASLLGPSDQTISLLLKWSNSLLDAATCLALAWAGWHLRHVKAGGAAAAVYALSPAPFVLFSAGNYSNLFAQAVLNITLLVALVFLSGKSPLRRWKWVAAIGIGFLLTGLGHYGMMLAALVLLGLFLIWLCFEFVRGKSHTNGWAVQGAFGIALLASFGLYYWHFTNEVWAQWSGVIGRVLGGSGADAHSAALDSGDNSSRKARACWIFY